MTKKDYQLITDAINWEWKLGQAPSTQTKEKDREGHKQAIDGVVTLLCHTLGDDNPLFKPEIFRSACFKQ